ncbi:MAG: hypothetical protein HYY16_16740 [Planctomycetes bacterium]|nr:hypothetical protein [Planctomycetota bacterium]
MAMTQTSQVRRRNFVIDLPFQLSYAHLWAWAAVIVIALFGWAYYCASYLLVPETGSIMVQFMIGIGVFFLLFCFLMGVVTLRKTHRVAGAAFSIERSLRRLRNNDLETPVQLRRGDYLKEVAQAFDDLRVNLLRRRSHVLMAIQEMERVSKNLSGGQRVSLEQAVEHLKTTVE